MKAASILLDELRDCSDLDHMEHSGINETGITIVKVLHLVALRLLAQQFPDSKEFQNKAASLLPDIERSSETLKREEYKKLEDDIPLRNFKAACVTDWKSYS